MSRRRAPIGSIGSVVLGGLLLGPAAAADLAPAAPAEAPEDGAKENRERVKRAQKLVEVAAHTKKNLREAIALYEAVLKDPRGLSKRERQLAHIDTARAYMRLGDTEKSKSVRRDCYDKGAKAAQAANALGEDADAVFWEASNLGRKGQIDGITNSLWLLPRVRGGFERAVELDPNHGYARHALAMIYRMLPGLMGGDTDKAEALFREILRRDPHFTPTKVTLAELLIEEDREDEAKVLLQEVVDEKKPSVPHDYRKFNRPKARKLLSKLSAQ